MTLRYVTRISALLKDHDRVRMIFERESNELENKISSKCFNSFIAGLLMSSLIFGGVFYFMNQHKRNGIELIPFHNAKTKGFDNG